MLCVIATVLAQEILSASGYTMDETCKYINDGFIADPTDCQGYGYCKNGTLITTGICPKNYIYNSKDGTCDYPSRSECSVASIESICKYVINGDIFADPNNCNQYCQCTNGVPVCNTCPLHQVYNENSKRCVWSSDPDVKCKSNSICRLVQNGVFAGKPGECKKYELCVDGTGTEGSCKDPYYFNGLTGRCEQDNGTCVDGSGNNSGGESAPNSGVGINNRLPDDKTKCSSYGSITTQTSTTKFVPDGQTCFGYYSCVDATGPGIWNKCPLGLHFNKDTGECVTPYTVQCTHDRCGNINQPFVGKLGNECKDYLICKDQVQTDSGECPQGLYFNEFSGTCGPNPASSKYKICELPTDN